LSYKIVGLLYKVHDELGRNAREKQYGDLFEKLLKENGVNYEREKAISKTGDDKNKADFVIDDSIVVELKARPGLSKPDYYQLKRYLEFANLKLGILVNFSHKYLYPKRIINSNYEE
jgi:GxxExxY protein